MPAKEELRNAIQSRRIANGLGYLALPGQEPAKPKEQLTPEEEKKQWLRKERNRIAASKCRLKRKERMEALLQMAEELDTANKKVESEIAKLRAEKDALVHLLKTHQCVVTHSEI